MRPEHVQHQRPGPQPVQVGRVPDRRCLVAEGSARQARREIYEHNHYRRRRCSLAYCDPNFAFQMKRLLPLSDLSRMPLSLGSGFIRDYLNI